MTITLKQLEEHPFGSDITDGMVILDADPNMCYWCALDRKYWDTEPCLWHHEPWDGETVSLFDVPDWHYDWPPTQRLLWALIIERRI